MHSLPWLFRATGEAIDGVPLQTSNVAMVIPILYDNPDSWNGSTLKYGAISLMVDF